MSGVVCIGVSVSTAEIRVKLALVVKQLLSKQPSSIPGGFNVKVGPRSFYLIFVELY